MRVQSILAALTVAAGVAAAPLVVADPVYASTSSGYISGAGVFYDDLNDEGTLSTTQHSRSGAVWLWQSILRADGYSVSHDCQFGSGTAAATKSWQAARGLTADGVVGPNTFTEAGKNWEFYATSGTEGVDEARYYGTVSSFPSQRMANGRYQDASHAMYYSYTAYNIEYC
jgi:hypothetical protein